MTVSPEEALKREQGFLPVRGEGSIMNRDVLSQMLHTTKECAERLQASFRIFTIDTSSGRTRDPKVTCEKVADVILNVIEDHLAEEILYIEKSFVKRIFGERCALDADQSAELLHICRHSQNFKPRQEVESRSDFVQPLPVVIVRNKSGDILLMRRKERDSENPLHDKLTIWAGGHVRKEDAINGDPIIHCICRELNEELRLSVEHDELEFFGAVYLDTGGKTSKHLALVYTWHAQTDDVAVTLSTAEFFERRGSSLSGKFVKLQDLVRRAEETAELEQWSEEIIQSLRGRDAVGSNESLF